MTILQAKTEHIEAILALQEKYHVSNLTEEEKQTKGFVTMKVTPEQFVELVAKSGVFIALADDGHLAAYALTSEWAYYDQWAIIQIMKATLPHFRLSDSELTTENSIQYGPVCIDEAFRGGDILTKLFDAIQNYYAPIFPFAITFINKQNERSMRAHAKKTPLSIVGEFTFNGNDYWALACKINKETEIKN
ncbi:MAG: hypothetical protein JNL70_12840 [Saprospiraceae bacterium]|nr:hypothetical protein [Saprospiraceae bacterium]